MQTNTQPPEKRVAISNAFDVHSIFFTIQGEGPFTGMPAIFIRLAGCNLKCLRCDTDYTTGRELLSLDSIRTRLRKILPARYMPLVVITGGEPFRQRITLLVAMLIDLGYIVQIETNGTLKLPDDLFDGYTPTIVCSPKATVHESVWKHCKDVKYVLDIKSQSNADGLPLHALENRVQVKVSRPPSNWKGTIWLQPADMQEEERNLANRQAVINTCETFGYRLSLQTHKIIGVP